MPTFNSFATTLDNYANTSTGTNTSNALGATDGSYANLIEASNNRLYLYASGFPTANPTYVSSLTVSIVGKAATTTPADIIVRLVNSSGDVFITDSSLSFTSTSAQTVTYILSASDITILNSPVNGLENTEFEIFPNLGSQDIDIDSLELTAEYVEANTTWTGNITSTADNSSAATGYDNVTGAPDGVWTTGSGGTGGGAVAGTFGGFPGIDANIVNGSISVPFRISAAGGAAPAAPAIVNLLNLTDADTSGTVAQNPDINPTDTSNITSATSDTRTYILTENYLGEFRASSLDAFFFTWDLTTTGGNPNNRRTTQMESAEITINYYVPPPGDPTPNMNARVTFIGL